MSYVNSKNDAIVSEFSLRFRLLMSYHNLTLKDIACYTDSAVSTVGTWKNGRMPSSPQTIARLAEIFHVSETYLLSGQTNSGRNPEPNASERVLRNIDDLLAELESHNPTYDGRVEEESSPRHRVPCSPQVGQRQELEDYFRAFLVEAERYPNGLAHVWYQLRREFPQDLFRKLREPR